jgi:hypothetical protein
MIMTRMMRMMTRIGILPVARLEVTEMALGAGVTVVPAAARQFKFEFLFFVFRNLS